MAVLAIPFLNLLCLGCSSTGRFGVEHQTYLSCSYRLHASLPYLHRLQLCFGIRIWTHNAAEAFNT